jgi:lactate racemase
VERGEGGSSQPWQAPFLKAGSGGFVKVDLKYGVGWLTVDFEETSGFQGVMRPLDPEPLGDPSGAITGSLDTPISSPSLYSIAKGKKSACVVISDSTRPVPNRLILPPVLQILETQGIAPSHITILIATGIHRASTEAERLELVGPEILARYAVVDHLSKVQSEMVQVGLVGETVPALINGRYVNADLKILTGFIEPHMWAGYSGGRKSILPGISSVETLEYMHGPEMIAHPETEYGKLEGNLFHRAGLEVMDQAGADFIVNVTLNAEKEVTGVFSGDPVHAHLAGCRFLERHCVKELKEPLDFIVTTNAGAPLDCNLYQTVKGITGASPVVKKGGDIVIASRCTEGVGSEEYRKVLDMVDSPETFLGRLRDKEFFVPDQWCAQETYQVVAEKDVWLYTEGLPPEQVAKYHMLPVDSIEKAIKFLLKTHGPDARWAIVPEGPMLILRLSQSR